MTATTHISFAALSAFRPNRQGWALSRWVGGGAALFLQDSACSTVEANPYPAVPA
jgi:hypothetical protein